MESRQREPHAVKQLRELGVFFHEHAEKTKPSAKKRAWADVAVTVVDVALMHRRDGDQYHDGVGRPLPGLHD